MAGVCKTVINFDAPHNIDIYVHRIGRACRTADVASSRGVAATLLTANDAAFAAALVKHLQAEGIQVSRSLAAIAESATTPMRRGNGGLGFGNDEDAEGRTDDAFAGYFKPEATETPGVVVETGSQHFTTLFDPQSNTYTTVATTPVAAPAPLPTSTPMAGFVSGRAVKTTESLPVSSYGGPDDEWDSSKMALESALAAIRARKGVERGEREGERERSRSRPGQRRSASRSRSRSHRKSASRSHHSRSHRRSTSRSRSHRSRSHHSHHHRSHSHRHYTCLFSPHIPNSNGEKAIHYSFTERDTPASSA